jgi:hypothetical protein
VDLTGLQDNEWPQGVKERVFAGETIQWETRGFTFEAYPSRFPSGSMGASSRILKKPEGVPDHRAWMYYAKKTGRSKSLEEAFKLALKADSVEIPDPD